MRSALVGIGWCICVGVAAAQTLHTAANVSVVDTPDDAGGAVDVAWQPSPDEAEGGIEVLGYEVWRATSATGEYKKVADVGPGKESYSVTDNTAATGVDYFYKVKVLGEIFGQKMDADTAPKGPVTASPEWFRRGRLSMLIASIILATFILL
jgi:hypothetical protein